MWQSNLSLTFSSSAFNIGSCVCQPHFPEITLQHFLRQFTFLTVAENLLTSNDFCIVAVAVITSISSCCRCKKKKKKRKKRKHHLLDESEGSPVLYQLFMVNLEALVTYGVTQLGFIDGRQRAVYV